MKTNFGDVEICTPRDRKREFESHLPKKNQTNIRQDIAEKILSMYAKGMTTSDIETHIRDIYDVEVPDTTVSRIAKRYLPMKSVYAVIFMGAIHYHVHSEDLIVKNGAYITIGTDPEGYKDVLGMWVGENDSARYWATVLSSLKSCGIEDIFIVCTDNLTGSPTPSMQTFPRRTSRTASSIVCNIHCHDNTKFLFRA